MQLFLSANSGLASRFPNQIEFPDYTGEELYRITLSIAKSKGYNLDESCRDVLIKWYDAQQAADAATTATDVWPKCFGKGHFEPGKTAYC